MKIYARELKHEDKERASFLVSFVYRTKYEDLEKRKTNWNDEGSEMWGSFVDDKLASVIYNNHFHYMFDDQEISMSGVGGVATLPEYRSSGCVSEIFKVFLNESYKRGEILSSLYPFSHSFYRNFGYDIVPCRNTFTFEPSILNEYKFDGNITLYEEGMDINPFNDLYNEFIKNYNFMTPRTKESWNYRLPKNVFRDGRYAYLITKDNVPLSYIIYKNNDRKIDVIETVWKNNIGFNAILSFLSRFSSDYQKIILTLPINIDLKKIIHTRNFNIEKDSRYSYMIRVVNVLKALELMSKKPSTSFTIEVKDDIVSENNHTYKVTNEKVEITNESPDVKCDIRTFSQLYVGALSLEELSLKENFEILNNKENIKLAFDKKPVNVNVFF